MPTSWPRCPQHTRRHRKADLGPRAPPGKTGFQARQAPEGSPDGLGSGVWKDPLDQQVPKVSEEPKVTQGHLELASEARWAPPESQVNPGSLAMLRMGSLGVPALEGRQDQLDTLAPQDPRAPLASVTPPSVPTSPASLPDLGM